MAFLVLAGLAVLGIRTLHGPKTQTKVESVKLPMATASSASAPVVVRPQAPQSRPSMPAGVLAGSRPSAQAMPMIPVSAASPVAALHPLEEESSAKPVQATHPDIELSKTKPEALSRLEPAVVSAHRLKKSEAQVRHKPVAATKTKMHKTRSQHKTAASHACERVGWYVQVGAFARKSSFETLSNRLEREGFETCEASHSPQKLSLLLVGAYPTREHAHQAQVRLKKLLGTSNYLRHIPK